MRKRYHHHSQTTSIGDQNVADTKKTKGSNLSKNLRALLDLFLICFFSFICWKVLKYVAAAYDFHAMPLVKKNSGILANSCFEN